MNCLVNHFSNIPLKKLLFFNYLFGILTGFPFMIGTIYLCFNKSFIGILLMFLSILFIIIFNFILNRFTKVKNHDKNIYPKLIYTFLFLGLGMMSISQIAFLFIKVKL